MVRPLVLDLHDVSILYPLKLRGNLWFSDIFREYKRGTLGRNKSSFLTHFSPMFLFCTPCKKTLDLKILTSENLRSSIVFRG